MVISAFEGNHICYLILLLSVAWRYSSWGGRAFIERRAAFQKEEEVRFPWYKYSPTYSAVKGAVCSGWAKVFCWPPLTATHLGPYPVGSCSDGFLDAISSSSISANVLGVQTLAKPPQEPVELPWRTLFSSSSFFRQSRWLYGQIPSGLYVLSNI